jgi:hypothetical protein
MANDLGAGPHQPAHSVVTEGLLSGSTPQKQTGCLRPVAANRCRQVIRAPAEHEETIASSRVKQEATRSPSVQHQHAETINTARSRPRHGGSPRRGHVPTGSVSHALSAA